jgi:hypothetical protein
MPPNALGLPVQSNQTSHRLVGPVESGENNDNLISPDGMPAAAEMATDVANSSKKRRLCEDNNVESGKTRLVLGIEALVSEHEAAFRPENNVLKAATKELTDRLEAAVDEKHLTENKLRSVECANKELYHKLHQATIRIHAMKRAADKQPIRTNRSYTDSHLQSAGTSQYRSQRHSDAPPSRTYMGVQSQQDHGKYKGGKVGVKNYKSDKYWDLGLCFEHFLTKNACCFGEKCEWRHEKLNGSERAYILKLGGAEFLRSVDRCAGKG